MRRDRQRTREVLIAATLLIALASSLGFAGVFTYYPVTISLSPVSPPVNFTAGSNAGQPDLGSSNTIAVNLDGSGASATITIHPTFQTNYYKNITLIKNNEPSVGKAYNVYIKVVTPLSLPTGSTAKIYIYNKGASRSLTGFPSPAPSAGSYVASVDLTSTGQTSIGSLSAGSAWEVDILVYIPESSTLPSSTSAQILLIYTPSGETPP